MAGSTSRNVGVYRRRPDFHLYHGRRRPVTITAPPPVVSLVLRQPHLQKMLAADIYTRRHDYYITRPRHRPVTITVAVIRTTILSQIATRHLVAQGSWRRPIDFHIKHQRRMPLTITAPAVVPVLAVYRPVFRSRRR